MKTTLIILTALAALCLTGCESPSGDRPTKADRDADFDSQMENMGSDEADDLDYN